MDEFDDTSLEELDRDGDLGELDGASEVAYADFSGSGPVPAPRKAAASVGAGGQPDRPDSAKPYFANAAEWVEHWLVPHYKRNPKTHLWDERWWEYTEVIAVFEALWQAWEFLRQDSMTGPAVFFRDYLWPCMRELTGPDGPFWKTAEITERSLPEPWAALTPPAGMFRPADHPDEQ